MGGNGGHRQIRIVERIAKPHTISFGHTLDFERQNFEPFKHTLNRCRHHAKVLGTWQHAIAVERIKLQHRVLCVGTLCDRRHLLHGLVSPKLVVALVKEVVVQMVESLAVGLAQSTEKPSALCSNAWVKQMGVCGIAYE